MHREIRKYLTDAEGVSDLVVVIFLDVRGFSSFAGMAESSEAALFLRSMYINILDDYFPDTAFFKPTGDGLMIIRHIERDSLNDVIHDSILKSLQLVKSFATISAADPMVNFDVPSSLGIGIARGAATRLASGDRTLDYSGRPLNLAARLMDLARPFGVVIDQLALKGIDLDASIRDQFTDDEVYVKGIADLKPVAILRSQQVSIRHSNRHPLVGKPYVQKVPSVKCKELFSLNRFIHYLDKDPIDPDSVTLQIALPAMDATGKRRRNTATFLSLQPVNARRNPKSWELIFDYSSIAESVREDYATKPQWEVKRYLRYSIAEEAPTLSDANSTDTGSNSVE